MKEINLILQFISQISSRYPLITIAYEYDEEQNEFIIWHNDCDLEFNNPTFSKYIGEIADEYLFKNKIYNFSFGYDHFKSEDLKHKMTKFNTSIINDVIFNYVQKSTPNKSNYVFNFNLKVGFVNNIVFDIVKTNSEKGYTLPTSSISLENTIYQETDFEEAA